MRYYLIPYGCEDKETGVPHFGYIWCSYDGVPSRTWAKGEIKEMIGDGFRRVCIDDIYEFKNKADYDAFTGVK